MVVENITRFLRDWAHAPRAGGHRRHRARSRVAVLGCTATLMFAFLPLLFLPGGAGRLHPQLPLAVVFTIAASLLVSLTVIPFLASRLLSAGPATSTATGPSG